LFEEGNGLALTHGGDSPRVIAAKAKEVHASLLVLAPYLAEPIFAPQVSRYLEATAREQLLHQHIMAVSEEKGPGRVPQRVWEAATAATRLASKLADDLGLSPRGHAELKALAAGAEVAQASLADLAERGRVIREARLAEFAQQRPEFAPESGATDEGEELGVPGECEAPGEETEMVQ
jgi:hypothetical protein